MFKQKHEATAILLQGMQEKVTYRISVAGESFPIGCLALRKHLLTSNAACGSRPSFRILYHQPSPYPLLHSRSSLSISGKPPWTA